MILFLLNLVFSVLAADDCCVHTPENIAPYTPPPAGMVWVPTGEFTMGSNFQETRKDESPAHRVLVDGFWLDATLVTNRQFQEFVEATGYVTTAEKAYGSFVANTELEWVAGANWRQPFGAGSSIDGQEDFPVVHVSWYDATSYARWKHRRLPTEAEWEYAACGGRGKIRYPWGNSTFSAGSPQANLQSTGLSSVRAFPPNGYSLYDMAGNAWQWCADCYSESAYSAQGTADLSLNPKGPRSLPQRVLRGGCYSTTDPRITARSKNLPSLSSNQCSFRCAKSP